MVDPRRPARDAMAAALLTSLPQLQTAQCAEPMAFRPVQLTFDSAQPFQAVRLADKMPMCWWRSCLFLKHGPTTLANQPPARIFLAARLQRMRCGCGAMTPVTTRTCCHTCRGWMGSGGGCWRA